MGISLTGMTVFTKGNVAKGFIVFFLLFALFVYLFGPPITPALRNAAIERCNAAQGGDYRSYQVEWLTLSFFGSHFPPHWECTNVNHPERAPINFGWWAGVSF